MALIQMSTVEEATVALIVSISHNYTLHEIALVLPYKQRAIIF